MKALLLGALTLSVIVAVAAAGEPNARQDLENVLRATPNLKHGAQLFATCGQCHGGKTTGLLAEWVPEIASQHARVIAKQLVDYRHGKRWDDRMEHMAGEHTLPSTQDIADVAAYAEQLPPRPAAARIPGESERVGKQLYEALCSTCHGLNAEGNGMRFVPRLAGQRNAYLLRQLHDVVDGRRPNMAAMHAAALRKLDVQQLAGLADYMSQLPAPGAHRS